MTKLEITEKDGKFELRDHGYLCYDPFDTMEEAEKHRDMLQREGELHDAAEDLIDDVRMELRRRFPWATDDDIWQAMHEAR